ncbi:MFS transporter [Streptomonospora litoralis]|uniref:Purine ribonucleoside efflux pump NepI n=1 Tax=Streptomonospora litoralis TaxID=2498135 RepID=A0A4P6Q359_9ACTN|nr:MFS transporter [Streptomonospora litoralis]QBI55025.1 Purine ribonucleoside efflux pump NepI [Streptomonospora litoralis]
MTAETAITEQDTNRPPPLKAWSAVCAVALGIFALMTTELLPVGLLTPIAAELDVSAGTAGLMVTVPGVTAAAAAPTVTAALGRIDRRTILAALIGLMALANLASALAPTFAVLLAARVAVGAGIGGFWAIAGGLAVRLVPERHVARATAVVFGGVSTASLIGVPAGTFAGDLVSWRFAFGCVAALGAAALVLLLVLVPTLPAGPPSAFAGMRAAFAGNAGVRLGLAATALLVTGHFTAYTFVRPLLTGASGIEAGQVGMLLLGFGAAQLGGNALAGSLAGRNARTALLVIALVLTAALSAFSPLGSTPLSGAVLLLLWGLGYGGVSVGLQTWMIKSAPGAVESATALFVSAFNASIALGGAVGGLAVDRLSGSGALWCAAGLTAAAALAVALGRRPDAPDRSHSGHGPAAPRSDATSPTISR